MCGELGQVTLDEILEGLWIDFIKPFLGGNVDSADLTTFDRVFKSNPHAAVHKKCSVHWKGQLEGVGQRKAASKQFKEDLASLFHPSMAKWWYAFAVESGFMPGGMGNIVSMSVPDQRSKAETTREHLAKQNRKGRYAAGLSEASTRELQGLAGCKFTALFVTNHKEEERVHMCQFAFIHDCGAVAGRERLSAVSANWNQAVEAH